MQDNPSMRNRGGNQNNESANQSRSSSRKVVKVWNPPHVQNNYQITFKESIMIKDDINSIMKRLSGLNIQELKEALPEMLDNSKI